MAFASRKFSRHGIAQAGLPLLIRPDEHIYDIKNAKHLVASFYCCNFAALESATLPVEQRTRAELFLFTCI